MAKTTTKTEALEKIKAKKIGANIVVTIGTEKYTKKGTAEEWEEIKKKVELYEKKPSEAGRKAILKLAAPETIKAKEVKEKNEAKAKGIKQQIKKENKKEKPKVVEAEKKSLIAQLEEELSDHPESVDALQKILDKFKKVEEKAPIAQYTKNPRRGEAYRNGVRVTIYTAEDGREVDSNGYLINPV